MGISISQSNRLVRLLQVCSLLIFLILPSQNIWAARAAIVMADQAVVYADDQLSAPVGYVRKGKKISIGESPKNRPDVFPVVVSGKTAFIRVSDVSTERQNVDSTLLVAERFKKVTEDVQKANYTVSYFSYATQIGTEKTNSGLSDKDALDWHGLSLKGGAWVSRVWDLEIMLNLLNAKATKETFNMVELGAGTAFNVYEKGRFKVKLLAQLLLVPFANYAFEDKFRVNGFGFSTGAGASLRYRLGRRLGIEGFGGLYYTSLSGFKSPPPYSELSPSFIGTRFGIGLNYQY